MSGMSYIIAFGISALSAMCFTLLIIFIARKRKILDYPDRERKIHHRPTPLWGGLAVFLSFNLVVAGYLYFTDFLTGDTIVLKNILGIALGSLFLAIGGALDDKYNLKPRWQIVFPILAILSVIVSGIGIDYITNPAGDGMIALNQYEFNLFWHGGFPYKITLLADIFTFLWMLAMIYTTKLIDGLDGLVSGITAIGAVFIFLTSLNKGDIIQFDVALMAMILAGVFCGFLVFNFNPAVIFLGEGGSTMAGFFLGALSIISGSKVGITLVLLSIPALDMVWTILRRLLEKKSPFSSADRKHLHHRLLSVGLTVKQSVLLLYGIAVIFGILIYNLQSIGLSFLLIGLIALVIFFLIMGFVYKRTREAGLD